MFVNDEPVLIRNYDYSPLLCDGLVLQSAWSHRRIIGMADCMTGLLDGMNDDGLLDGMNDDGLAVSLAFGGRRDVGEGFGVTLVLRYVLETCGTVSEAVRALRRVPVQVAYNIALLDRDSNHATVKLAPDREAVVTDERASTNHQGAERWHEYTKMIASEERLSYSICSSCHGSKAQGLPAAPTPDDFPGPRLTGQHDWYLIRQLEYFKNKIRGANLDDRPGLYMRTQILELQKGEDVRDVVAYIMTLQ